MYSPSSSIPTEGDTFVQSSTDHIQGPPRKKMRKGTRSCLECRRRKIKCTFEPHRPAVCNECFARGSTCIDQEHGDLHTPPAVSTVEQSYSLRERVTQLEGLVREVLNRLPENSTKGAPSQDGAPVQGETQAAAEALENLKTSVSVPAIESALRLPNGGLEDAPVLSLFDNAVLSRKDDPPIVSARQHNKTRMILRELLSLLPSPKDLDVILEASSNWWNVWREIMPMISDTRCETYKEAVSHALRSDSPAEVAKIILCIAISMDQMPAGFEGTKLNLPAPARQLMEHYVNKVDELITSDDEIGATLDGIECMVLQGKFHINMGRPRRAWILFRRAIGFAQLLGLHRVSNKPIGNDPFLLRQQSIWMHLFQGDRYISLILGLPYAVPEKFCVTQIPDPSKLRPGERYLVSTTSLVGKIVDRNQDPAHMSFADTLRLDAELEEIAHSMPADWWSPLREQGGMDSTEAFFDKLIAQFFHHQIRTLIHLPFMLKSSSDKRYHYSHQAAVDSARQMIRHFSVLREDELVGPFVCKLIDFQAFTAAMLVLLNILGYKQNGPSRTGGPADDAAMTESNEQDVRDWELIDETIACLRRCSQEPGGIVAAQAVKALEMMSMVRNCKGPEGKESKEGTCRISIPYFGTITIGAGSKFQMPPPKPPKHTANLSHLPQASRGAHPELPTPPASTITKPTSSLNGSSNQPSPISNTGQSFSNASNTSGSAGTDQTSLVANVNDQYISFDNFMGLPQTDFLPFQTSMPMDQQYNGLGATAGVEGFDTNTLTSWPYTNPNIGAVDLDQDWNWVGNNPFGTDWNNGMDNSLSGL